MKCGRRLGIWHFLNWLLKNTNCFWLSLFYNLCTMGSPLIHGLDSEVILPEEKSQCCQSYSWESCKLSFNFQNPGPQILKRTCILFMHINTSSLPWNNGVQGFVWTKNYSISYFKKKTSLPLLSVLFNLSLYSYIYLYLNLFSLSHIVANQQINVCDVILSYCNGCSWCKSKTTTTLYIYMKKVAIYR